MCVNPCVLKNVWFHYQLSTKSPNSPPFTHIIAAAGKHSNQPIVCECQILHVVVFLPVSTVFRWLTRVVWQTTFRSPWFPHPMQCVQVFCQRRNSPPSTVSKSAHTLTDCHPTNPRESEETFVFFLILSNFYPGLLSSTKHTFIGCFSPVSFLRNFVLSVFFFCSCDNVFSTRPECYFPLTFLFWTSRERCFPFPAQNITIYD